MIKVGDPFANMHLQIAKVIGQSVLVSTTLNPGKDWEQQRQTQTAQSRITWYHGSTVGWEGGGEKKICVRSLVW